MIKIAGIIHGTGERCVLGPNGPGVRTAIWVQGCTLGCRSCHNPSTWSVDEGEEHDEFELAELIVEEAVEGTEGITLSGGEPLQQAETTLRLVQAIKDLEPDWTVFLFTGLDAKEIHPMNGILDEHGTELMAMVDVAVVGRYVKERRCHALWRGSSNQEVRFLSDAYRHLEDQVDRINPYVGEFHVNEDGGVVMTGFASEVRP